VGSTFDLVTDHAPLVNIFQNPASKLPARLQRLALRLQAYSSRIHHMAGKTNPADWFSRMPTTLTKSKHEADSVEEYINFVIDSAVPKSMSLDEITAATADDPVFRKVAEFVQS
jgi:hypothetical protein